MTGTLPLGERFGLFAKAGVMDWQTELSARDDSLVRDDDATGKSLCYGAGVSLLLGERFSLRAEWERFQDVGNGDTTGSSDADLLTAGFAVHF